MSDLVKEFQAQTRLRANPTLIDRWEFDMRFHGDTNIKKQASQAKRTATVLRNSYATFQHLDAGQKLAFQAAADGMQRLAEDLAQLATWAKFYLAFCKKHRETERVNALEEYAAARWGDDVGALKFEHALLIELSTSDGQAAFAQWMKNNGHFDTVELERILVPFDGSTTSLIEKPLRIGTAEYLWRSKGIPRSMSYDGRYGHCSFKDYEEYLAFRKRISSAAQQVIKHAQDLNQ